MRKIINHEEIDQVVSRLIGFSIFENFINKTHYK